MITISYIHAQFELARKKFRLLELYLIKSIDKRENYIKFKKTKFVTYI